MKIVVITQPDILVIPKKILLLAESRSIDIAGVNVLDVKGPLSNKRSYFLKGFGCFQIGKLALLMALDKFVKLLRWRVESLKKVAKSCGADYKKVTSLHRPEIIEYLRSADSKS